jgi:hypothetical protein
MNIVRSDVIASMYGLFAFFLALTHNFGPEFRHKLSGWII